MTDEQLEVLTRAAEASYFRDECRRWWNSEPCSKDELAAAHDFAAKAVALVGDAALYDALVFGHDASPLVTAVDSSGLRYLSSRNFVWARAYEELGRNP